MSQVSISDHSPIDIVIYLHNDTGIMLKVQDGQNADAKFLFDLLIKELDVKKDDIRYVREVFSLWLVSDLLELQLKPSHVPFKLVCYWEELLEKYVHCNEETRQRDEAVIMLQRNVYVPYSIEETIKDPSLLKLLYCEAKKNIMNGKYPINREDADELAILQTKIMSLSGQDSTSDSPNYEFFANKARDLLPPAHCRRSLLMNRKQNPENRLMNLYSTRVSDLDNQDEASLCKAYLRICRKLPNYGAAFFRGQAEHRGKKLDDPVWIAINRRGVTIICINDQMVLLTLPFDDLAWQCAESSSSDANYLPCLFLHFPHNEQFGKVTKLLQIFSKAAYLADNLIETFSNLRRQINDPDDKAVTDYTTNCLKRLALMTFDEKGNQVSSTIRLPKRLRDYQAQPV